MIDVPTKGKKYVLEHHFNGLPTLENFKLVDVDIPELQTGEILVEALFFSVDPYMRPYSARLLQEGSTMIGSQVAKVVATKNGEYPLGTRLVGYWGWSTHTVVNPSNVATGMIGSFTHFPDIGSLSPSLGLGAIGMPGNTAYFGLLEICQPKEGDVVVVTGAAGAVGSLVGQIAKIKGCYVIGFAGSDDKVKWLVDELGFDKAYNYKTADWDKSLKEAAPKGVDCYFDNVGGLLSTTIRNHMKDFGRISVCGSISTYNDKTPTMAPACEAAFVFKQLKMEGFLVGRWMSRWMEGLSQMTKWIQEGKIKVRETYTDGFENMPQAFIDMLNGVNTGKAIIKA